MGPLFFGICLHHPHAVCWNKTNDVSSIWAARTGVIYLICQQSKGQGPVEQQYIEKSWQHSSRRGNHGWEGSLESPLPVRPFPVKCVVSEVCTDYLILSSVSFDQLSCLCQTELIWLMWTPHLRHKDWLQTLLKAEQDFVDNQTHVTANRNKSFPSACTWTNKGLVWNWRSQKPVRDPI